MIQAYSVGPRAIWNSLWVNRSLVRALVSREIVGRYRGSMMGMLWSIFNPIFMLLVYTFIFSVVFKARWQTNSDSRMEFAFVLFAGLIVFNVFSECVNRAPTLVLSNANYVKKVVFPLEILPWVTLGSALFHGMVSVGVWLIGYVLFFGLPPATAVLFPLILAPLILLVMGFSWALASLGVYLRDVSQVVGIFTMALMFLAPVFYPTTALPAEFRSLLYWNPLTQPIEEMRAVLFWGKLPDFARWAVQFVACALIAWLGFAWFQKTRKGFADVL
jgi:lipopolysaccharide transport system permease protein